MKVMIALMAGLLTVPASAQELTRQDLLNLRSACEQDVRTQCPGITPGGGQLAQCLNERRDALSDGCELQLENVMSKRNSAQ